MPAICEPGGQGMLLPLSQAEHNWNKGARAVVYILVLFYMFKGVGVCADFFMNAVEQIISQKRRVFNEKKGRYVTYLVWNSTVADLSLLALGSSAPEILLSMLEMVSGKFYSGDLGPSTIVGSAAFNLLVIVAVCVVSIPGGEIRRIANVSVYHVTLIFGTFAYVWLLLIVQYITPNVIDLWEAIITFFMFPILVYVSWLASKGKMNFLALESEPEQESQLLMAPTSRASLTLSNEMKEYDNDQNLQKSAHPRLSLKNRASLALVNKAVVQRASQRASAKALSPQFSTIADDDAEDKALPAGSNGKVILDSTNGDTISAPSGILTFRSDAIEVQGSEEIQKITIQILRCNGSEGQVSCSIKTEGISGVPGHDFEEVEETLTFMPGETVQQVDVKVLPQRRTEPHDVFQLVMSDVEGGAFFNPNDDGGAGCGLLTITITNSSAPSFGELMIDGDNLRYGYEVWKETVKSSVEMEREEGEDGTEPPPPGPMDYVSYIATLPFNVFFSCLTPPPCLAGGWLLFIVALSWVGVVTALIVDLASLFGCCAGIADSITAITIVALGTSLPDTFASMASAAKDDTADSSIVNVTGSNSVNVFLGIGIPWLAAAIYWQVAGADGQPEEWKKKYSHLTDVLNNYPNAAFVVEAGALGFSVLIFNCVAFSALAILRVRRLHVGGELGGPQSKAMATSAFFITLWLSYVGLSIWRTMSQDAEVMVPVMGVLALLVILGAVGFELSGKGRFDAQAAEGQVTLPNLGSMDVVASSSADAKVQSTAAPSSLTSEGNAWTVESNLEPSTIGATTRMSGRAPEPRESIRSESKHEPNAQEPPVDETLTSEPKASEPEEVIAAVPVEIEATQPEEAAAPKKAPKKKAASPKSEAKTKLAKKSKAGNPASSKGGTPKGETPAAPAEVVA